MPTALNEPASLVSPASPTTRSGLTFAIASTFGVNPESFVRGALAG